jgi:hypothetical protein
MAMMLGRRLAQIHKAQRTRDLRERQTFIALRACRKAVELARRVRFGRPVDVSHTYCQACGAEVDCSNYDDWVGIQCSACSAWVRVPGYLRGRVQQLDAEQEEKLSQCKRIVPVWNYFDNAALPWKADLTMQSITEDQSLEQVEWNFVKTCAVTLLVLMTVGLTIFFGIFVASR